MSIMRPEGGWNITRPPVHPCEMLRHEFMKPLGISINGLALERSAGDGANTVGAASMHALRGIDNGYYQDERNPLKRAVLALLLFGTAFTSGSRSRQLPASPA